MNPVIMRMVVDFPAPFGPRKPSTSPRSTVNEMSSTARLGPKAFTSLSIFIMLKEGQNYRRITIPDQILKDYRTLRNRHWRRRRGARRGRRARARRAVGAGWRGPQAARGPLL